MKQPTDDYNQTETSMPWRAFVEGRWTPYPIVSEPTDEVRFTAQCQYCRCSFALTTTLEELDPGSIYCQHLGGGWTPKSPMLCWSCAKNVVQILSKLMSPMHTEARTFLLGDTELTEGDTLTITTPELGTIEVPTLIQFMNGIVFGLDLGRIQTGYPCHMRGQRANANLSLYTNGVAFHTLQVAYLCTCPHQAHNRSLRWMVRIEGRTIRTESLGTEYLEEHNHVVVDDFAHLRTGVNQLQPVIKPLHSVPLEQTTTVAPMPVVKPKPLLPEPEVNVGRHGQINLF